MFQSVPRALCRSRPCDLGSCKPCRRSISPSSCRGWCPWPGFYCWMGKIWKNHGKKSLFLVWGCLGVGRLWNQNSRSFHHLDNKIDKKFTIRMNSPTILMGFRRVPKFGSSAHSGFVGSHLIMCQLVLGGFFPCLIARGFPFFQFLCKFWRLPGRVVAGRLSSSSNSSTSSLLCSSDASSAPNDGPLLILDPVAYSRLKTCTVTRTRVINF